MFIYFCRGLSGNKVERPTCRDYIEISTHRAILHHLEDSRSHETEAEAKLARPRAPAPLLEPNQDSFARDIPPTYWIKKNIVPPRLLTQKRIEGEDYISKAPLAPGGDKFFIELRGALEGKPLL